MSKIKVLLVKPQCKPEVVEIGDDLKSMQNVVGGLIERFMPFDDENKDIALVCNEEGKLNGLKLNRAIYDNSGNLIDIIAGTFFVCSAPIESEKFKSLNKNQQFSMFQHFKYSEEFFRMPNGQIQVVKIK